MDEPIIMTSFIAAGVALIICAIILRQSLSGKLVLDFSEKKLGLAIKTDAFGLIVLVGLVMIGTPIFLWYKGYEDRIKGYKDTISGLQQKAMGLEESICMFKEHDLTFNLIFTGDEQPDIATITWPPIAYVQRVGERAARPYDLAAFARGPGGVMVNFKKLHAGDRLYVVLQDGSRKWQSLDMIAPGAQLEMKLEKSE